MDREMYPHTLTAWRPAKDGRSVSWQELGTMPCRWDAERPVAAGTSGETASWEASVLVPSGQDSPPLQAHDRVQRGCLDAAEPPADALSVVRCDPVSLSSASPDHWEAVAR